MMHFCKTKIILSVFSMASKGEETIFRENIGVGCQCFNPNLSNLQTANSLDYVVNKKRYIIQYLMNLVLHKSNDLIGIKKCYGKSNTNISILQSSYRSHQNTLRKLREVAIKKKSLKPIKLSFSTLNVPVEKYISTITSVCETFENIFSNLLPSNHLVHFDLLIKSCQFHLKTLNVFEEILIAEKQIHNGGSIEVIQHKSIENATVQLD